MILNFFEKCISCLTISSVGLSLALQAIDYPDEYDSQPVDVSYGRGEWQISDEELANKVRQEIGSNWFSSGYEQVSVEVKNGVVTLKGTVETEDDKKDLEEEISEMKGVKKLINQIFVDDLAAPLSIFSQDTYETPSDKELNQKIRVKIAELFPENNYKNLSLNTSKGIVTLEGSVNASSQDQENLIHQIHKIEGVKGVKNRLLTQ